ncbi:MAG: M48 family metallopeptidase [Candidatus Dadabacteria bacterium]|nr:M48 family metallopeptidase [Candidatus Dadabacteria bacterium]MYA48551.1 M48 family metallopeptidase [Candidatus Dadabacteria bacterium]MYG83387.1 M48 family metallopeptidase [Candidatus Dadabacteria bacterium]MYK49198.1 M48 family metallopeptidase [Candidatus Dadabacteria bacterium]
MQLGASAYLGMLETEKVSKNKHYAQTVTRVGQRIAAVSHTPNLRWQYTVFDNDKMVNAFALPGGKIGVYTGMMPVAKTDAGLATVMAHEVAHATARHGGERLSLGILLEMGSAALASAMKKKDRKTQSSVLAAYGIGTALVVALPFSRKQESEADRIGLIYMAKAGYDPREAIPFWERMGAAGRGSPPEFLSTHPGYRTRIKNLRKWIPEAMEYYEASRKAPNNRIIIAKETGR